MGKRKDALTVPTDPDMVEAAHLTVEPYDEADRVDPPDWYDDTINVGEVANAESST